MSSIIGTYPCRTPYRRHGLKQLVWLKNYIIQYSDRHGNVCNQVVQTKNYEKPQRFQFILLYVSMKKDRFDNVLFLYRSQEPALQATFPVIILLCFTYKILFCSVLSNYRIFSPPSSARRKYSTYRIILCAAVIVFSGGNARHHVYGVS